MDIADLFLDLDYKPENFIYNDINIEILSLKSASTDHDLTGQVIWPAAIELSKYIIKNHSIFDGKTVLELGAGAGLSGIVAAQYAKNVIITDGNDIVVDLLKKNVDRNQQSGKLILGAQFIWGQEQSQNLCQLIHNSIENWDGKIDFIIGADIIHWPTSVLGLGQVVQYFSDMNKELKIILTGSKRYQKIEDDIDKQLELLGGHKRNIIDAVKDYNEIVYIYEII